MIGILALQGNYDDIASHLNEMNVSNKFIKYKEDLVDIDALIIPGGESSTVDILLGLDSEFKQQIINFKKPIMGICAGLILLNQYKFLDCNLERNGYGRQNSSFFGMIKINDDINITKQSLSQQHFFIRAPKLNSSNNKILATYDNLPCAVQNNNILGISFHPELVQDNFWFDYFINNICQIKSQNVLNIDQSNSLKLKKSNLINLNIQNELKQTICPFDLYQRDIKRAFPRFLKGGVIMDVVNKEQAIIAEKAGATCVMALEKIPADIKKDGGISRMSDPAMIQEIQNTIDIPVMAKARIGHFGEAKLLQALNVDCIDESEVLTNADKVNHIYKEQFYIPFVCGARNFGEACRRIQEGAAMIRIKGDAGSGNIVNAVEHLRLINGEIKRLQTMSIDEIFVFCKQHQISMELAFEIRQIGRLPVVTFAAGGIATPADVKLCMELGCDGVFVGSGIFKSENPEKRARAIVEACTFYQDDLKLAEISKNLGKPMVGILFPGEQYKV